MGYTLAPETLQVLGALAMAVGIILALIVLAIGLAHFGHMFITTRMD